MQPSPRAEISRLLFPSLRFCIVSPLMFCLLRGSEPRVLAWWFQRPMSRRRRSEALRSGGVGGVEVSCRRFLCQYKVGEVFKHPLVLERSVDDSQKFARQGDDRFPRATPALHLFVVSFQIRAVALRDQGALDQRSSAELGPAFGDPPAVLGFIGIGQRAERSRSKRRV